MKTFWSVILTLLLANISFTLKATQVNDTSVLITIKNKIATVSKPTAVNKSISISEQDSGQIYIVIDKKQNLKVYFRNADKNQGIKDVIIDSSDFINNVVVKKDLRFFFNNDNCDNCTVGISFKNDSIKDAKGDVFGEIQLKHNSTQKNISSPDSLYTFIPLIFAKSESQWPNFISDENENIKYRFAIDFSSSFSQASVWELKNNKDSLWYKKKDVIRPKYLRFMTLSIKNYYPQYDSITASSAFNSYNLEGRTVYEKYQNTIIAGFEKNTISNDTTKKNKQLIDTLPHAASKTIVDSSRILNKLFNKLNLDFLQYSNYLNRNIINKSIWVNDVQFINSRLNFYLGLTNFSVGGLHSKLVEITKGIDFDQKDYLINSILVSYAHILDYSIMSTSPIQIKDMDLLTYNLDFFKQGKKVETRDYSFLIKGGFKIDYSTGFAYSSLRDESYQIINAGIRKDTTFFTDHNIATDSVLSITNTNLKSIGLLSKDINVGFTALMHFYPRTGSLVNLGGTFGFMLNTKAEFNYLLGISLLLGQQQRFILNGGAAFGQVNRLNPKYDTSKSYDEIELNQVNDSQLTIKKWDIGYFLGISYNLGNIR